MALLPLVMDLTYWREGSTIRIADRGIAPGCTTGLIWGRAMKLIELIDSVKACEGLTVVAIGHDECLADGWVSFIVDRSGMAGVFEMVRDGMTIRVGSEPVPRSIHWLDDCLSLLAAGYWTPVGIDRDDFVPCELADGLPGAGALVPSPAPGQSMTGYAGQQSQADARGVSS